MFNFNKKENANDATKNIPDNPYTRARKEFLEQYGNILKYSRISLAFAFISLAIALISVIGVVYIGSQSKFIPYVVEIDKLGSPVNAGVPQRIVNADPKVIKYTLAEFISNIRSVYADKLVQEKLITKSYNYLEQGSQAQSVIGSEFRKNNPIARSDNERVSVNVLNVSPISQDTWQVDWQEKVTTKNGEYISNSIYRAIISTKLIAPETEKEVFLNPIGLWIHNYNYSKVME